MSHGPLVVYKLLQTGDSIQEERALARSAFVHLCHTSLDAQSVV